MSAATLHNFISRNAASTQEECAAFLFFFSVAGC